MPNKNSHIARIALLTTLGLVLFVGLVLFGVANYWTNGYDRIYANVFVGGKDLAGMTVQEATDALDTDLRAHYEGKTLSVTVDNRVVEISSAEAGLKLTSGNAARSAYELGRVGSFFQRLNFVMHAKTTEHRVEVTKDIYIDEDVVNKKIAELISGINKDPVEHVVDRESQSIEIEIGKSGRKIDDVVLKQTVLAQLTNFNFAPITINSQVLTPRPIDLDSLYKEIHIEMKNATAAFDAAGNMTEIQPEVEGVTFNKAEASEKIEDAIEKSETEDISSHLSVPIKEVAPEVTVEMLRAAIFRDVLGEYETVRPGSSSSDRWNNIIRAAEYANNTILQPGDVFSFNGVVGERTKDRGFKVGIIYQDGKQVEDVGGGICQEVTTIYGAALYANMKIVERTCHSLPVHYGKPGLDATVSYGYLDFKFQNNTPYPLKVVTNVTDGVTKVQILGTNTHPDQKVVMETTPSKYSSNGYSVQSYRLITDLAGKVLSRTHEADSFYKTGGSSSATATPAPTLAPGTTAVPGTVTPPPATPSTGVLYPTPTKPPAPATPKPTAKPTTKPGKKS